MNRQIDINALVSHLVSGDGMDRCRICMGDTSEGQVFLSDTVMMDDDRRITLAELLENVTGIEVNAEEALPEGVCSECVLAAMQAAHFRTLTSEAIIAWHQALDVLHNLPAQENLRKGTKGIFAIIKDNDLKIVSDSTGGLVDKATAAQRLQARLYQIKYGNYRNEWIRNGDRCSCPDCGKQFFYAYHLHAHLNGSNEDKRACPLCAYVMSRDELVRHLRDEHAKKPHPCNQCTAILISSEGLKRHRDKWHSPGGHQCVYCGRVFHSKNAHQAHVSMHEPKTCQGCKRTFANHTCYLYHIKHCDKVASIESDDAKRLPPRGASDQECFCDVCKKRFTNKRCILAHMQHVHLQNSLRACPYCPKTMPSAYLYQHLKTHKTDAQFVCAHCGLSLKSKVGYTQHVRLHTGEKPYACKVCGEAFSSSSRRSEHVKKNHRGPDEVFLKHACQFCPARFRLPYRLRNHIESVHTANQEDELYTCDVCHSKFTNLKALLLHCRRFKHTTTPNRVTNTGPINCKTYSRSNQGQSQEDAVMSDEVEVTKELPPSVCATCADKTLAARAFTDMCRDSTRRWSDLTERLQTLDEHARSGTRTLYVLLDEADLVLVRDIKPAPTDTATVLERFRKYLPRFGHLAAYNSEGPTNFLCPECEISFPTQARLSRHLRHSSLRVCKYCGQVLDKAAMVLHMKQHRLNAHPCPRCPEIFHDVGHLRKHLRSDHPPGAIACRDCGRRFKTPLALQKHSEYHLTRECKGCGRVFVNRKCYISHRTHCAKHKTPVAEYTCNDCGKAYHTKMSLVMHMKLYHLYGWQVQCSTCGKRVQSQAQLREHENTHNRVYNYTCEHCGLKMSTRRGYQKHVLVHVEGKPHACTLCEYRTNLASLLAKHMARRHDENKEYVCTLCTVRFDQLSHLRCHMMTKHTDSTFECPSCDKTFASKKKLMEHQKEHTMYKCRKNAVVIRRRVRQPRAVDLEIKDDVDAVMDDE